MTSALAAICADVRREVLSRTPPGGSPTRVVAVDGPGGAGKSTFARHLSAALDGAQVVHTDDFASWTNPIDWWPELIERVLAPIARGEVARFEPSSWGPGHHPAPVEVQPAHVLIVEGVTASREAFQPYLSYSIWIDAPEDVRVERGLARDGKPSLAQWRSWIVVEDAYKERERPHERADLVLDGALGLWT